MKITKFDLGFMSVTMGVKLDDGIFSRVPSILRRHRNCDYGDIPKEDAAANDFALRSLSGRVVSSYRVQAKKVLVITDGLGTDDVSTMVLLPKEY